ncbi:class I SAM-dependent methyltransferase [Glaciimonas sp. GG7]
MHEKDFQTTPHVQSPLRVTDNAGPKPSAQMVAIMRATHQLLDSPLVLDDPLALRILGSTEETWLRSHYQQHNDQLSTQLRALMVVRSRLTEDEWLAAERNGVRQYVILGAGLDTYPYRCGPQNARIFEVDLPATQAWKRACLHAAGIAIPADLTYVPIDFEESDLEQVLMQAGLRKDAPVFFSWLGVTFYIEEAAIMKTLSFIASCAAGSAVIFDYGVPPSTLTPTERVSLESVTAQITAGGEPWKTYLDPASLSSKLHALGFSEAHNFSSQQLNDRYLSGRTDRLQMGEMCRLMHASV